MKLYRLAPFYALSSGGGTGFLDQGGHVGSQAGSYTGVPGVVNSRVDGPAPKMLDQIRHYPSRRRLLTARSPHPGTLGRGLAVRAWVQGIQGSSTPRTAQPSPQAS